MPTISLCMIVKNEEDVLARCLAGVREFADEIIIVDTGSTDRTREIAKEFTDRIYDFPWIDDFAAARNFAFSKGTGDYLFWLDADDVITEENREKLLEWKQRMSAENEHRPDVVMLKYAVGFDETGRPVFVFYRERLIRRCPQAVWKGRIHEAVAPFGKVVREDITVEHHKIKTTGSDRNLRIFESMIEEGRSQQEAGENTDKAADVLRTRDLYYYGKELYYHKRYADAIRIFHRFLERPDGWREDRIDACRHMAFCLEATGQNVQILSALLRGLEYAVPKPELCCDIGAWFLKNLRYPEAIYWYRQALVNRKGGGHDGFIQEEYHGYIPCLQLCVCYDRLKRYHTASRYNEMADRLKPGTEACARNRTYFEGKVRNQ